MLSCFTFNAFYSDYSLNGEKQNKTLDYYLIKVEQFVTDNGKMVIRKTKYV